MLIEGIALVVLIAVGGLAATVALGYRRACATVEDELRGTSNAITETLADAEEASRSLAERVKSLDDALRAAFESMVTLTNAAGQYSDGLPEVFELLAGVSRTGEKALQSLDNVSRGLTGVGEMLARIAAPDGSDPAVEPSE